METASRARYYDFAARHAVPKNRFGLQRCDHFGVPARDPELAGRFYEDIMGGVEFFRAGYDPGDDAKGKMKHIFYHVGATLVEVVEQEDGASYPDVTNPESRNMNPHWMFETTAEGVLAFRDHLQTEGIPFAGPRSHPNVSGASVYFRDVDGNNLEVGTWEAFPPEALIARLPGEKLANWAALKHHWRPH